MFAEFRKFIMRGNVLDLAVGIIIGAAFTGIVTSLVNDVIMPPIGLVLGGVDFSNIFITLKEGAKAAGPYATVKAAQEAGAVTLNIGLFINALINFLIVAFVVFLLIRGFNQMMERFKKKEEVKPAVPATPTAEERLIVTLEKLTKVLEEKK
jgi:large conductance mechanosensitive channel